MSCKLVDSRRRRTQIGGSPVCHPCKDQLHCRLVLDLKENVMPNCNCLIKRIHLERSITHLCIKSTFLGQMMVTMVPISSLLAWPAQSQVDKSKKVARWFYNDYFLMKTFRNFAGHYHHNCRELLIKCQPL